MATTMANKKFNPDQFNASRPSTTDPDADIFATSVKISILGNSQKDYFIPSFPLRFLQQTAQAGDALPVLLVALMMMRMKGEREIALGPALWKLVGDPSPRVRARLLKKIAGLPESLCTLEARTGRPHLLRTGPDWPAKTTNQRER